MGTRSTIIVKVGKVYKGIYCHWDGYPEGKLGVGYKLHSIYNTQEKVEALVELGDLSSLRDKLSPEPGTIHTFDKPQTGVTVAYGRDRGEKDVAYKVGKTVLEVEDLISDFAYSYVFKNGSWRVRHYSRKTFKPLAKVTGKEVY